jgi:hypothetical protein
LPAFPRGVSTFPSLQLSLTKFFLLHSSSLLHHENRIYVEEKKKKERMDPSRAVRRRGGRGGAPLGLYAGAGLGMAAGALYLYLRSQSTDLPRDLKYIWLLLKFKRALTRVANSEWTTADYFAEALAKNPDGEAIRYLDGNELRVYTYREVEANSNRGNQEEENLRVSFILSFSSSCSSCSFLSF